MRAIMRGQGVQSAGLGKRVTRRKERLCAGASNYIIAKNTRGFGYERTDRGWGNQAHAARAGGDGANGTERKLESRPGGQVGTANSA